MGLIKNFRSSLENPATPLTFPKEWEDFMGGLKTTSGVRVSEHTALQIPAVFACVRIIAEGVASLPLRIYERLPTGVGRQEANELPLYDILHFAPNPEMTSFTFRETLQGHLCLWGNAYAEIQRDEARRVIALWPRHPHRTKPVRLNDGEVWYLTTDGMPSGKERLINSADMLHVVGLSQDGLLGMSPIQQARQALGLAVATEAYGASFFGNGSRPGGILSHPKKLDEETSARLKKTWQESQGGDKAHSVAVLEEGMEWTAVGISPNESQFLETRKFQKSEIASIFRVPPHMIADLDRSTHSNIEQQSLEFVCYCLTPWLVRWEQELTRKLFNAGRPHGMPTVGRTAAKKYFPEFAIKGLVRGDFKTRYEGYAIARQWGWMNPDDIRAEEGLNPLPNGVGQIYLVPMNMVDAELIKDPPKGSSIPGAEPADPAPVVKADEPTEPNADAKKDAPDEVDARSAQLMPRFISGFYRMYRDAVGRAIKRGSSEPMDVFRTFGPVLSTVAEVFAQQACAELRTEPLSVLQLNTFVQDFTAKLATRISAWTEENADDIAKAELQKGIRAMSIAVYREAATQKAKRS